MYRKVVRPRGRYLARGVVDRQEEEPVLRQDEQYWHQGCYCSHKKRVSIAGSNVQRVNCGLVYISTKSIQLKTKKQKIIIKLKYFLWDYQLEESRNHLELCLESLAQFNAWLRNPGSGMKTKSVGIRELGTAAWQHPTSIISWSCFEFPRWVGPLPIHGSVWFLDVPYAKDAL